ncbi:MAG: hypothetical protein GX856_12095 [Gammaproteobacteria bacterium]|nr:hypothetical protein [Gammaproteobacteria bacterium]
MRAPACVTLAALSLALDACSDPSEAYTPVDELPSADVPATPPADAARDEAWTEDAPPREPVPTDPLPAPVDPDVPPTDSVPPPLDPEVPIDEATRPPPVDPTMEDGSG